MFSLFDTVAAYDGGRTDGWTDRRTDILQEIARTMHSIRR